METHARQVTFNTKPFEITATKDEGAKMVVDRLIERFGRGKGRGDLFRRTWVSSISIDPGLEIYVSMWQR